MEYVKFKKNREHFLPFVVLTPGTLAAGPFALLLKFVNMNF